MIAVSIRIFKQALMQLHFIVSVWWRASLADYLRLERALLLLLHILDLLHLRFVQLALLAVLVQAIEKVGLVHLGDTRALLTWLMVLSWTGILNWVRLEWAAAMRCFVILHLVEHGDWFVLPGLHRLKFINWLRKPFIQKWIRHSRCVLFVLFNYVFERCLTNRRLFISLRRSTGSFLLAAQSRHLLSRLAT